MFDYPFVLHSFLIKNLLHTLICFHSLLGEDSDTNFENDSEKLSESVDEFSDIRVIETEIQQNLNEMTKHVEDLNEEVEEKETDTTPERDEEIVTEFEELVDSHEDIKISSENQIALYDSESNENETQTTTNEQFSTPPYEQKIINTATASVGTDTEQVSNYHDHYNIPTKISPPRQIEGIVTKVSTGCGPSPPREVEEVKRPQASTIKKATSTSTGTSPPPQNISTQVSIYRLYSCTMEHRFNQYILL